jgi:hypothetical protein
LSKARQIRDAALTLRRQLEFDDLLVCAGVAVVSLGVAFVFWPAALMLAGASMVVLGVMRVRA